MSNLHNIQMLILRELLFKPNSRFTDLNIKGLSNDHFSYHVRTLLDDGYVTKEGKAYSLTTKGKEYANRMDTDDVVIEKQPKIAVMILAFKEEEGKEYMLIQERTKEPYFGYAGFLTGKIRYGEKVEEAARRELKEESGLEAKKIQIKKMVHDHVVLKNTGELVEDKMFYIVVINGVQGELVDTECGKNSWITEEEFYALDKKYYNEDAIYEISKQKENLSFLESTYLIEEF